MGVTVQAMVDAEVSGVLFTCNPVSGDPSMVALNASWGLGIGVVGGEVTPDDYLVSKVTGEVVRQTVSTKHHQYVPDPAGRARLVTNLRATGSVAQTMTMGIVFVATCAAAIAGLFVATMISTLSPTSSAASWGNRSALPSADRHSIAIFCFST